ncbi:MAG: hypothetical protein ACXVHS_04910 [Methanobacterium sp.]
MVIKGLDIGINSIIFDKHTGDVVIKFMPLRIPLKDLNLLSDETAQIMEVTSEEKLERYLSRFALYYLKNKALDPKAIRDRAKELGLSPKQFEEMVCNRVRELGNVSTLDIEEEPPARVDGK